MVEFVFHYFFWDISLIKLLYVIAASLLLFVLYYLFAFLFRKSYPGLKRIVIFEEFFVTNLVALWMSTLFCLHVALPLWIGFYFVYSRRENENRAIKYYHSYWSRKYDSDKFEKTLAGMKMKSFLKDLYSYKQKIFNDTDLNLIPKEEWKTTKLSKLFYVDGLLMISLSIFLWGNPYKETGIVGLIFFGNLVLITGPYYILWRLRYRLAKGPPSRLPEAVIVGGAFLYLLLASFVYAFSFD